MKLQIVPLVSQASAGIGSEELLEFRALVITSSELNGEANESHNCEVYEAWILMLLIPLQEAGNLAVREKLCVSDSLSNKTKPSSLQHEALEAV